jgi:hypothetical protein
MEAILSIPLVNRQDILNSFTLTIWNTLLTSLMLHSVKNIIVNVCDTAKCISLNKGGGVKTLDDDKLCRKYACYTRQQYNIEYIQSIIRTQFFFFQIFILTVLTKNNITVCQSWKRVAEVNKQFKVHKII